MSLASQLSSLVITAGVVCAAGGLAQAADPFTLTSPTFKDGTMLATKNAGNIKGNPNCVGDNVSPPLAWSNAPAGTKSFALLMVDPDGALGLGVIHWVAYGIPATVTGFAEGEVSKPSDKYVGGKGTRGESIYLGPCPPPGTGNHHYTFTLVATDLEPKALQPGLTYAEAIAQLKGHAKAGASLIGLFGRP